MRDACAGRTYLNYTLQVRAWNVFIDGSHSRDDGQTQKKLASIQHSNANANQYADDARSTKHSDHYIREWRDPGGGLTTMVHVV